MTQSRRQFSTKSLRILADNATTHLPPNTLDNFLATLTAIDDEIHSELTRTRAELAVTTTELAKERALRKTAESRLNKPATSVPPPKLLHTDKALLRDATPAALIDLLHAREDAFHQQSSLVHRLKAHNSELRQSHETLSKRISGISGKCQKNLHNHDHVDDNSVSSLAEGLKENKARRSCGSDSCEEAAVDLLKTITIQQQAHERLRTTITQLTSELERINPRKIQDTERSEKNLRITEQKLSEADAELSEKDVEIAELKKQLKKVLAEYEAVSVAHSYSNAELSKIRANGRGKGKNDRVAADRHHTFGTGVENLRHPRKIHFR